MKELTEKERRMAARAVHESFIEAVACDDTEKADVLENARDKLDP